jgi:hypothetical protein
MSTSRSTASARPAEAAESGDSGTGLVGTLVGFAVVITLLLFATQMLVRLYDTSSLTAAAERAAETVAQSGDPTGEIPSAEAQARGALGGFGERRMTFHWLEVDGTVVVLQVRAESPAFIPGPVSWREIERTVSVPTAEFR